MDFKDLSKEERLIAVYKNYFINLPKLQLSLKEGRTNERFLTMSQWEAHQMLALKLFFIDHDTSEAKQHFYTCGKLDELGIVKYDEKILDYGINHLSYALLSDCSDLIERYARLKHSNYDKAVSLGNTSPMYILQCLIKDDWAEYERVLPIMKTKTARKLNMQLDLAFYEALAGREKSKMEQILAEFVTPVIHKERNSRHDLINEFISHPALGYAKLAWMKGIEVEVKSPLVPAALLPVKPLDRYENRCPFSQTGQMAFL